MYVKELCISNKFMMNYNELEMDQSQNKPEEDKMSFDYLHRYNEA